MSVKSEELEKLKKWTKENHQKLGMSYDDLWMRVQTLTGCGIDPFDCLKGCFYNGR